MGSSTVNPYRTFLFRPSTASTASLWTTQLYGSNYSRISASSMDNLNIHSRIYASSMDNPYFYNMQKCNMYITCGLSFDDLWINLNPLYSPPT